MAIIELITKQDLQEFKEELFAELRRAAYRAPVKTEDQREWLKSYEVRKLLGISPGTLQHLRKSGQLRFSKIGGLMFYRYEDLQRMMELKK